MSQGAWLWCVVARLKGSNGTGSLYESLSGASGMSIADGGSGRDGELGVMAGGPNGVPASAAPITPGICVSTCTLGVIPITGSGVDPVSKRHPPGWSRS